MSANVQNVCEKVQMCRWHSTVSGCGTRCECPAAASASAPAAAALLSVDPPLPARREDAGELGHITPRRRHGWRHSRKKQDVEHRETGTHETQPNSRAGRVVQLIGAEWSGRLGSCRVTWAAPNPASVARGPGDAPSPPSDPRKHHHPPSCLDLRIDPPLWDVLPVRPKFCLLSEDR